MTEKNRYMTDKVEVEDTIDVAALLAKLWDNKRRIIICGVVGAVVGLIMAFSIPKIYKSGTLLAPEVEQSMGSGISSIASMMGVSLDNSVDAINVSMFPDIVVSTPFLFKMFDLEIETKDGLKTDLLDYMMNHQKKSWMMHVVESPFTLLGWILSPKNEEELEQDYVVTNLPKPVRRAVKSLGEAISVGIDKKTGVTAISVEMQDPYVAATFLNAIVENLKTYMTDYRTAKVKQDVENLTMICEQRKSEYVAARTAYAEYADTHKNLTLYTVQAEQLQLQQEMNLAYQVYSQVATQLEASRIKEQQSKPVFVILEPVTIPLRKSFPSKPIFMLGFAFFAALAASVWYMYLAEFYEKFKNKL